MCGLIGNNYGAPVDLDAVRHRGPDGRGQASVDGIVHGHTRLALLDLTDASAQPFHHKGSVLAFNGEVWNYRELRASLQHAVATTGDTEVLAALLDERGLDGLNEVDGMFAFSWSHPTRGHWLARDRYGKIPLYASASGEGMLTWASERKAFLRPQSARAVPSGCALNLRTGAYLRWARPRLPDRLTPSIAHRFLSDGVAQRMHADAPVCCLISGGLDSSLILSMAQRLSRDVTAFTAKLDESSPDLKAARRLCAERQVALVEVPVSATEADYKDALRTIEINSKAQVEIAVLCLPLAAAIRAEGFKAVLSGEAADELFGGYGSFCIKASRADDAGIVALRQKQVAKMARGNFVRCNKVFMRHGVECRLPFMEERLAAGAIHATKADNPPGKKLLKAVAADELPSWIVRRPKETFQNGAGSNRIAAGLFAAPQRYYGSELQKEFGCAPRE